MSDKDKSLCLGMAFIILVVMIIIAMNNWE